jgi:hypothetical protein
MRSKFDTKLPEDIFHYILNYLSSDSESVRSQAGRNRTLLTCALVSRSWAQMCRSRSTFKLSTTNFRGLRMVLESPLSTFAWARNLTVGPHLQLKSIPVDWFHETVPYLSALKRLKSLSFIDPPSFSNFDELLNLLCIFPSLQSLSLCGVHISDMTWSPSRSRSCLSLSSITIRGVNPGIFQWLHSQNAIHAVRFFRASIGKAEDLELIGSFLNLNVNAGTLKQLHISFERWNGTPYGENYLSSSSA